MTLFIPEASKVTIFSLILGSSLTLKLYSNNKTPAAADTAASYTEVSGGGYSAKTLTTGNWTKTAGSPAVAQYNAAQDFNFTGTTASPSVIYGYFIIDGSSNLIYAERFPSASVPFTPINGSLVRVTPRITLDNAA